MFAPNLFAQDAGKPRRWTAVPVKSTFRVELGKTGWLRMLGDDHQILVSEYTCTGQFDPASPAGGSVTLVIPAQALKVLDPNLDPQKRAEVQGKMEGREVLDVGQFPEIRFASSRVTHGAGNRYRVDGKLTIRSTVRELTLDLTLTREADRYRARGRVPVRMTQFGIEPPSAGGGSIKVKDEMNVTFDLLLMPDDAG